MGVDMNVTQMGMCIMGNLIKARPKGMEYINGPMERNTMDNGKEE